MKCLRWFICGEGYTDPRMNDMCLRGWGIENENERQKVWKDLRERKKNVWWWSVESNQVNSCLSDQIKQQRTAYPQIATPYVGAVTISNAVAHGSQPVCLRPRLDCVPQLLSYHRSQYYNLVCLSLILLLFFFLSQINTKKLRLNDGFLVLKDHEDKFEDRLLYSNKHIPDS